MLIDLNHCGICEKKFHKHTDQVEVRCCGIQYEYNNDNPIMIALNDPEYNIDWTNSLFSIIFDFDEIISHATPEYHIALVCDYETREVTSYLYIDNILATKYKIDDFKFPIDLMEIYNFMLRKYENIKCLG
jgi:hypothetical protein